MLCVIYEDTAMFLAYSVFKHTKYPYGYYNHKKDIDICKAETKL